MPPVRRVTLYGATTEKDPQPSQKAFSYSSGIAISYPRSVIVTFIGVVFLFFPTPSARQYDPEVVLLGRGSSSASLACSPIYQA